MRKLEQPKNQTIFVKRKSRDILELFSKKTQANMADFQDNPPHPLFPPLDDGKSDDTDPDEVIPAPLVTEILVQRVEQGKKVTCPRAFRGEELLSLVDLCALYGGGEYELIAKHAGRITARRRYTISGPSKPMYDTGPTSEEAVKAPAIQAPMNPLGVMMGEQGGVMGLIMMMMQQMMQQQAAAQQSQTQMFIAMMQNSSASSKEDKELQRAELAANIERDRLASERTMSFMREMMANRPAGGSDEFTKGVEFMRAFATTQIQTAKEAAGASGDSELERLLGTGMELLQGYMQFKQQSPAQAPEVSVVRQ